VAATEALVAQRQEFPPSRHAPPSSPPRRPPKVSVVYERAVAQSFLDAGYS